MKKRFSLYIFGAVFAMMFTFGAIANAQMFGETGYGATYYGVDKDLAIYNQDVINNTLYGNDKANNSVLGSDIDADFRAHALQFETYGLMGNYDNWAER
ncbi:MAG: hypothetical protein AAGU11_02400 [Syntrophobacteraceae bacterium]